MRRHLLAFGVVLVATFGGACAGQELVLVDGENPPCPILAQANASNDEWTAATLLAKYLTQMSDAKFTAQKVETPPEGRAILVGSFGSEMANGLPGDSFVIRTENGRLHIAGSTPLGTAFGVFAFLEEDLGCRWWSHTEEDVPKTAAIRLPAIDRTTKAVFSLVSLYNNEAASTREGFRYKCRGVSSDHFTGGHNLYPLLTPYAKEHPDIYPYNKKADKRGPNDLHFCYSHPDIAQALADAITKQVEQRKGEVKHAIYFAGMGDWYGGMCECERCKQIYEEETWTDPDEKKKPGYTGTLLRMINGAAEILEQKYPGIRVGTFAYMSLEAPPGKTVPRDNVVIRIPHLRHCILHGVDKCPKNRNFYLHLKRWCELAPGRVCIWDYGVDFGENFLYPFPVINSMADNIRLFAQTGVSGEMIQGNYVSTGSDLVVLKNYVWRKLIWNPSLKTEDLIKEFCDGYYGPAAKDVCEYVMLLEDAAMTSTAHLNEFAKLGDMKKVYLGNEMQEKLRACLDRALAAAQGDETYARRVREAMVSLEAVDLWRQGPLVEQDGRLVRGDMGNQYTYPRALALVEHCREASPREWGSGLAYRQGFLALHGGPLPTLSRGDVKVKIAPVLVGRLYQIAYGDKELLRVGAAGESGYPLVGGSWEQLDPGARVGEMVGEPTETKVEIELPCGISLWSHAPKMVACKTVELLDDGAIRITGDVRPTPRYPAVAASENTEYAVGKGKDAASVSILLADETWQEATFVEPKPAEEPEDKGKKAPPPALEATVPEGARALRVSIPGKGCVVEDRYLQPAVAGGKLVFDMKAGVLTTRVQMTKLDIAGKGKDQWLVREIRIQRLAAPAEGPDETETKGAEEK